MRLKGRYIPDSRVLQHEPAGVYEDPYDEGMSILRVEPLSVITITPRPVRKKRKSVARKVIILMSAIMLPVLFVSLADALAVNAGLFFGSFAISIGWPAFVYWANIRD